MFLVWYVRKILNELLYVSENMGDFLVVIDNYAEHLETVYNMETYYGDETIKFLMSHTKSLLEMLDDYEDIYSITVPILEEEFDEEKIIEGEQNNGETQINEENVFYGGTRSSNN